VSARSGPPYLEFLRWHLSGAQRRVPLCRSGPRPLDTELHLPFDENPMLSVILSKAFLLGDDDRITDPSIVGQLDR
jgi:hypothetical protein